MIKILFNPEQIELINSCASIIKKHQGGEICLLFPVKTEFLPQIITETNSVILENAIGSDDDDDYYEDFLQEDFDLPPEDSQEKIILVGVYPKNSKEEVELYKFVDEHSDEIILWVDNHKWSPKLLKHLKLGPDKLKINEELTCLEILASNGYFASKEWLGMEKALIQKNWKHNKARRYLQALEVNQAIDWNWFDGQISNAFIFTDAVYELLSRMKLYSISGLSESYLDMKNKTEKAKQRLNDRNPAFQKAKKLGRAVGSLVLRGEVDHYLDIDEVLNHGVEKYPWLCVISVKQDGETFIFAQSKKIPIRDIISLYKDEFFNPKNCFKILNAEVVTHQNKNNKELKD